MAGDRSRRKGRMGEALAEVHLRRMGLSCIEKVEPARTMGGVYLRQCSGDFRAVGRGGRSVLVEVKARDRNLRSSDFQMHQRRSLIEHAKAGGLSLIAHVRGSAVEFHEVAADGKVFAGVP